MPILKISMAEIVASTLTMICVTTPLVSISPTQFGPTMVMKPDWTAQNVDVVLIQPRFTMFHVLLDLLLPHRQTSRYESKNKIISKVWTEIFLFLKIKSPLHLNICFSY